MVSYGGRCSFPFSSPTGTGQRPPYQPSCPPQCRLPNGLPQCAEPQSQAAGRFLAVAFLVFTGLRILVPLVFHGLRQLRHRQVEIASPDLVIEGVSAYHLVRWEQLMQTGITDAGIQRPLVFFELPCHPTKEAGAAANPMAPPRKLPVGLVDDLSTPC